jgi:hypothetical protein
VSLVKDRRFSLVRIARSEGGKKAVDVEAERESGSLKPLRVCDEGFEGWERIDGKSERSEWMDGGSRAEDWEWTDWLSKSKSELTE